MNVTELMPVFRQGMFVGMGRFMTDRIARIQFRALKAPGLRAGKSPKYFQIQLPRDMVIELGWSGEKPIKVELDSERRAIALSEVEAEEHDLVATRQGGWTIRSQWP